LRYGLALISAFVLGLAVTAAGSAEPAQIGSKRAEAQQVLAQIQAMDAQMEKAVEAYNAANVRLDQIKHDLEVNQARLQTAKKNLVDARTRVSERLVALYTSNSPDALSILLGASSLGDLIERLDSADRIAEEDARIAAEVTRYRKEVQSRQEALVKAEADQEQVVAERAAQRAIFHVRRELESLFEGRREPHVLLCDRGTIDGAAYWPGAENEFFHQVGTTREAELARYALVIHLRPPSDGDGYARTAIRVEDAAEAQRIDARIERAWRGHPYRIFVDHTHDFTAKVTRVLSLIEAALSCDHPARGGRRVA